jgi:transcriptional regulator with XRE-family HTH domain
MSEITLRDNLQQLMRLHGNISVSELARLTKIPQPTIHHILTGSTKNPRRKALEELSSFFSITVCQLIGQEPLPAMIPETIKKDLQISTVPLIDWSCLKDWPCHSPTTRDNKQILVDKSLAKDSFALIMPDNSMEPVFQEQMLLIFDSEREIKDRDFIIAYLSQEDNVAFNRVFSENKVNYLRQSQEDGNFKLTKLDYNNDRVLGTLIEARTLY